MHKEKDASVFRQNMESLVERGNKPLLLLLRKWLFSVSKCVTGN